MSKPATGRFWAVGVGPGDPELLTLKAVRIVRAAHVIYHAGPEPDRGRALEIVRPHLRPEQQRRLVLTDPMSAVNGTDWRPHYLAGVEQIAADCRAGLDVVCITEGDPTIYSTAAYVWQLLSERYPEIGVEVVPGVSSVTAAAASVGWPLAQRDQPLALVPAGYHAEDLHRWVKEFPTLCFLKPGKTLPRLLEALRQEGRDREAVYVENVGTEQQWMTRDLEQAVGRDCYFALVLVRSPLGNSQLQPKWLAPRAGAIAASKGSVHVVGLGPGAADLLTPRALATLRAAEVIVGFETYLQALAPLHLRAEFRGSPIGAEAERARQALDLAGQGRRVALVSSGDAGVYGMASLLLETAATLPEIDVEVVPGVTAAVAAAALLGAPLGHDFACVSLSDLLTSWDVIAHRLECVARGDLVLALYNPLSRRRNWQLAQARDILRHHRTPETPVGIVDRAYRPGMQVRLTTLGEWATDGVGMETTLIIGNRQTRVVNGRIVTPRGYRASAGSGEETTIESPGSIDTPAAGPSLGARIMEESFAIIERELGKTELPPWAFFVVRRLIHATADFDFARLLRYSTDFEAAVSAALRERAPVVTDTEMVRFGIRSALDRTTGFTLACHLNDAETAEVAAATGLTRSAAGIRLAARQQPSPLVVIGNAPTALDEALRLVEEDAWRPRAIIGMPVGFVGVEEAKARLAAQSRVPFLTCTGRKGGSPAAAAAVNALVEFLQLGR